MHTAYAPASEPFWYAPWKLFYRSLCVALGHMDGKLLGRQNSCVICACHGALSYVG